MTRKAGLPPVAGPDARLLILGSLPGDASLAAAQYYGHPQNAFWRLIGAVLDEDLVPLPYEARLERLRQRRVALWDVIGAAHRVGSLDTAIKNHEANDLAGLIARLPELQMVGFNGGTAAKLGRKALGETPLRLIDLPSSSPAFTRPFAEKLAVWKLLREGLEP
ncbi:hypoxanthine-DNA glycosylase [Caulobacter ginsengisoli]|uniref:Hypoxanthine-DNA glycosylase n=1 Tax=Caulobacter ginsengisoli TaxID=400775 RepID=A0ABU0INC0_9CAUL|nr:DNA-deoxyinosine glycosylase [Caulobacter ginsengisoli]MDQ0462452.1 hypoxanthine-DNA glycosylase [Caulobacter ginsengisoli]